MGSQVPLPVGGPSHCGSSALGRGRRNRGRGDSKDERTCRGTNLAETPASPQPAQQRAVSVAVEPRGGRSTIMHQAQGRQVALHVHHGRSRTQHCVPAGLPRTRRSCAPQPHVPRLLQRMDLLPRLAAEADGDGPDAFASVSMKMCQRTSDGFERQRNERYPEELGSMRLCQPNDPRSGAQELTARIQAQGSGPEGTRSRAGTANPVGAALPTPGEEGTRLSRQCQRPLDLGAAARAKWDAAVIPGSWWAVSKAPLSPRAVAGADASLLITPQCCTAQANETCPG